MLVVLALGPAIFNDYWVNTILTQMLIFGIAAASLIFLSAYGAMTSLAQTALMGISAYLLGNMVTQGGAGGQSKGLTLGWDPTLALVLALVITTAIGVAFGAVAARSFGIYFLMLTLTYGVIANYFFGQVTQFGGFSPIAGVDQYTPGFVGDIVGHPDKLYYIAFGVALLVYGAIRYLIRTPFGLSLQGVRDDPVRMSSLGYYVPLHRALAFGFASFVAALSGVLFVWWQGQIAPGNIGLAVDDRAARDGRDRRPDPDRGRLGRRLRLHRHQQLRPRRRAARDRRQLQHDHRPDLPGHRHRLSGRAHGDLGPPLAFPGRARRRNAGHRLRDSPGCSGGEHLRERGS